MATSVPQLLDAISHALASRSLGLVGVGFMILAAVKLISRVLTKNTTNGQQLNLTNPQVHSTEHHSEPHQETRKVSANGFALGVMPSTQRLTCIT